MLPKREVRVCEGDTHAPTRSTIRSAGMESSRASRSDCNRRLPGPWRYASSLRPGSDYQHTFAVEQETDGGECSSPK